MNTRIILWQINFLKKVYISPEFELVLMGNSSSGTHDQGR